MIFIDQERVKIADVVIDSNRPIDETNSIIKQHFDNLQARLREAGGPSGLRIQSQRNGMNVDSKI